MSATTARQKSGLHLHLHLHGAVRRMLDGAACGARARREGRSGLDGWLQRLAAWAERQPPHRRLGSHWSIR